MHLKVNENDQFTSKRKIPFNPSAGGDEGWRATLDPELAQAAAAKGWRNPAEVVRSYCHLEKMFGADRAGRAIMLPKGPEDLEAYEELYRLLGRPDSPDGYALAEDFEKDQPVEPSFVAAMAAEMHKAGLSKAQAKTLAKAYQIQLSSTNRDTTKKHEAELQELKRDWGRNYDYMINCARQGAARFGFTVDELNAVETAFGPRVMLEKLASIGESLGEDQPVAFGEAAGGFSLSPTTAKSKMDDLLADPLFTKRYLSGDAEALRKIEELSRKASR